MPRRTLTKPRKEASQERSKATVDTLLAATARVLVKEGYDRASTNRIAEAAGVSIGSLYQYFPSKEALVGAVLARHMDAMMTLVRESLVRVAFLSIEDAARELVRTMIDAHRLSPKLHRVLVEQIPRVGALQAAYDFDEEATELVRAYLEAHRDELTVTDLDLAAFIAVTSVDSLTHMAVLRKPALLESESFCDEVAALVVRYLRGGAAPAVASRYAAAR